MFILCILILFNIGSIQNSEELKCILINRHESRYLTANNWFVTFLIGNEVYASEMDRNEYKTVLDWYTNRPEAVWIFEPVDGRKKHYYIKNAKFNKYLYAKREYGPVYLKSVKNKNELDEAFVWYFPKNKLYFEIMNSRFEQSLFVKPVKIEGRLSYVVRLLDYENYDLNYDAGDIHEDWNLRCENDKQKTIHE